MFLPWSEVNYRHRCSGTLNGGSQRGADRFSGVAVGNAEQRHITGEPFHQSAHRSLAFPHWRAWSFSKIAGLSPASVADQSASSGSVQLVSKVAAYSNLSVTT